MKRKSVVLIMLLVVAILITGCGKEKDLRTDDEVINEIIAVTKEDRGFENSKKIYDERWGKTIPPFEWAEFEKAARDAFYREDYVYVERFDYYPSSMSGYIAVSGRIKNSGDKDVDRVVLKIKCLDVQGNVINTESESIYETIGAGNSQNFSTYFKRDIEYADYKLEIYAVETF